MILSIPFNLTGRLFKHKGCEKALSAAGSLRKFTVQQIAQEAKVSVKVAGLMLRELVETEHLQRKGKWCEVTDRIGDQNILLNLRDKRTDVLYRRAGMREVLYSLASGEKNARKMSELLRVPYRTINRMLSDLREVGVVVERRVSSRFIYIPQDPVDLVPFSNHRSVVRYFLQCLQTNLPKVPATVVYGKMACGVPSPSLEVALLCRFARPVEQHIPILSAFGQAAGNVTFVYGAQVEIVLIAEDAWLAQKLGIVANPHPTILEAMNGIFIMGDPPAEDDYFELSKRFFPLTEELLKEKMEKGYIAKLNSGKYVFTKKAINVFREKAPANIIELTVPLSGEKTAKLLTVGQPT